MFFYYFSFRISDKFLDHKVSPLEHFEFPKKLNSNGTTNLAYEADLKTYKEKLALYPLRDQFWMTILSVIQLFGLAMKFMETIRFNRKYGRIVQLVGFVIRDEIGFFIVFYLFWVFIWSFSFRILGNNIKVKDEEMDSFNRYFLHSWSQAVRSGKDPDT